MKFIDGKYVFEGKVKDHKNNVVQFSDYRKPEKKVTELNDQPEPMSAWDQLKNWTYPDHEPTPPKGAA